MRKGQNPARLGLPAYSPRRVGVGTLVYIPHLDGYYQDALEIVRAQIDSLRRTAGEDIDLLVFDNGSCASVQQALRDEQAAGKIDWLVLSRHNLGKTGALNWILGSLPNEILGYTDSDVLFRPGWLQASREILEAFPQAGLVTAQPAFFDILRGSGSAHLRQDAQQVTIGARPVARETWLEYQRGLGNAVDPSDSGPQTWMTACALSSGVEAVLGASHMQFLMPRAVAQRLLPLPAERGLDPAEDRALNQRVDDLGLLHLSTFRSYVFHMGNSLEDPELRGEIQGLLAGQAAPLPPAVAPKKNTKRIFAALVRHPLLRGLFRRLYANLFEIYAESKS